MLLVACACMVHESACRNARGCESEGLAERFLPLVEIITGCVNVASKVFISFISVHNLRIW